MYMLSVTVRTKHDTRKFKIEKASKLHHHCTVHSRNNLLFWLKLVTFTLQDVLVAIHIIDKHDD